MFDSILEKIEYEYLKWSNFVYAGSVAECMSRAFEIAFKRAFYQKLKEKHKDLDVLYQEFIMQRKNYIDFIYLKCKDVGYLPLANETISDDEFDRIIKISV